MMSPINFHRAKVIVELGPGTGVFTREILNRMRPEARLFAFETNDIFFNKLSEDIHDNRFTLFHESAELVMEKMKDLGITKIDAIVSSLPYAVFPDDVKHRILDACVKALGKDGIYVQFQYSLNAHKLLKEKFRKVTLDFTPINMPPAFVYRCTP